MERSCGTTFRRSISTVFFTFLKKKATRHILSLHFGREHIEGRYQLRIFLNHFDDINTFSQWNSKRKGLYLLHVKWHKIQDPVSVKLHWCSAMPVPWCIVYGGFRSKTAELSHCDRNFMTHKTDDIYPLALYRKGFLTPNPWYGSLAGWFCCTGPPHIPA